MVFVDEQSPSGPEEEVATAAQPVEERDTPTLKVLMWLSLERMLAAAVKFLGLVERSAVSGRRPLRR